MINKPSSEMPEQLKVFRGKYVFIVLSIGFGKKFLLYSLSFSFDNFLLLLKWLMVTP